MPLYVDQNDPTLPGDVQALPNDDRVIFVDNNNVTYTYCISKNATPPDATISGYDAGWVAVNNFQNGNDISIFEEGGTT